MYKVFKSLVSLGQTLKWHPIAIAGVINNIVDHI